MERLFKILYKILAVFFTLSVFLISGFIAIIGPATNKGFYTSQFEKVDDFGETVLDNVRYQYRYLEDEKAKEYVKNMTSEQLMDLMMHTMKYCLFLEDDLNPVIDGERLEIFREDEYSHMEDVKGVFGGGMLIVLVGVAVFAVTLTLGLLKKKGYYENCRKYPYYTLIGVLLVLGFIGIAAAIDFDKAFEIFHKIFFDGNWQFASGVMIAMIGTIFLDLVPIILAIWIGLLALFVVGVVFYNKWLKGKFAKSKN